MVLIVFTIGGFFPCGAASLALESAVFAFISGLLDEEMERMGVAFEPTVGVVDSSLVGADD